MSDPSSVSVTMPSEEIQPSEFASPSSPLLSSAAGLKLKKASDNGASTPVSPSVPAAPQPLLPPGKDIIAQLIEFFSSASSPVLGAAAAGVAGILCLIFGRIGILAVGVVLGVVGHAMLQDRPSRLESLVKESNDGEISPVKNVSHDIEEDLDVLPPRTSAALSELSNAMVREYIGSWYSHTVPMDSAFPASCHQHIIKIILKLSAHLSSKRPVDIFMLFVYSTSNTFIVFFRELSAALSTSSATDPTIPSYIHAYPNSALAVLLDHSQQKRRIHTASVELLDRFVPPELRNCEPLFTFLREILKNVVLEKVVENISDSMYINTWIIYMLDDVEGAGEVQEGVGDIFREFDKGVAGAAKGKVFSDAPAVREKVVPPVQTPHGKRLSKSEEDSERAKREAEEMSKLLEETERRMAEQSKTLHEEDSYEQNGVGDIGRLSSSGSSLKRDSQASDRISMTSSTSKTDDIPEEIASTMSSSRLSPKNRLSEEESPRDSASVATTAATSVEGAGEGFTSFDKLTSIPSEQIQTPQTQPSPPPPVQPPQQISFLRAHITIIDMTQQSNPPKMLKSKPTQPFMVQLEPQGTAGWIIMRTYTEFEQIHEVLRRIASISGAAKFQMAYGAEGLPTWKGRASDEVASLLELYLRIVVSEETLVESEALRRFFERDEEKQQKPSVAGWGPKTSTFKNMGGNVLGAITKAPQTATEGSKALLGNVFNAVGGVTLKRASSQQGVLADVDSNSNPNNPSPTPQRSGLFGIKRPGSTDSFTNILGLGGGGATNGASSSNPQNSLAPPELPNRPGRSSSIDGRRTPLSFMQSAQQSDDEAEADDKPPLPSRPAVVTNLDQAPPPQQVVRPRRTSSLQANADRVPFCESPAALGPDQQQQQHQHHQNQSQAGPNHPNHVVDMRRELSLPPPPSEIDDDYGSDAEVVFTKPTNTTSSSSKSAPPPKKEHKRLTEQETQFVVDIFFSLIQELYTLSSAWSLRRSLLNIAKTVLLRPGNASLVAIRKLIQENVIDSNTSDEAIAEIVKKIRKNALPTEAEMKMWEEDGSLKPPSEEEKEETRMKARQLIGDRGLPEGLKGLMGGMASRECVEVVFDSLQDPEVARGIMVSLVVEAIRGVCN